MAQRAQATVQGTNNRAIGESTQCRTVDNLKAERAQLAGTDLTMWIALRRADEGGLALLEGSYYHHGRAVPHYLNAPLAGLVEGGMLTLADPDTAGMRAVALTEDGRMLYAVLCGKCRVSSASSGEGTVAPSAP